MKLIGKVGIVFTLVLSLLVPITAFASSNQSFPKEVNGLPIIYIETEANTEGLSEGEAILVLLDPNSKTLRDSVDRLNFDQYLSSNPLPDNVSFTVVGGKGASQENFIKSHDETNSHVKQHGPVFVGGPGLLPVQTILTAVHPTFAIVQDTDPSWSQTIAAISAQWYAPYAGTSQTHWSAFMVNGVTNGTARPFVQCGHVFYSDGTGANIWSTTSYNYEAQPFDGVAYVEDHRYEFTVAYGGSSFGWWMGCEDLGYDFQYFPDARIGGDHLVTDIGTGVFFENWNTNSGWYSNFTNPCYALGAADFNGNWKYWDHETITILDAWGNTSSNNGKVTGTLVSGGTTYWYLNQLLLASEY